MKCDELKVYHCNEWHNEYTEFYMKSDADAAIDELKAEINHKECVGLRWFERCMEARTENVKLKRALWLSRAELCCRLDVDRYLRKHIYTVNFIGGMQMDICEMDMADIRRVLEIASAREVAINETNDSSEESLSEMSESYHNNKGATNER